MANESGSVLLALLTGAAIGAGVGILYAPEKGEKTRKKLRKKPWRQKMTSLIGLHRPQRN